ncbi:MAG TPA: serine hydroxymethyltransferase [Caldisericia bacterium]|nr:serine hydroxymethyltransferase [Caldisericia bacterium]HOR47272.1 serine hydroxymethyltransferase [Caldisericia bacterium]HOU08065.1 serine hydroxymethyltransferase [Caldisericia bacterium]HPL89054.1 serine hydroxymethyltransferase [Caldisericia bacterium]HQG59689.1 serine hydroxymethyltransferase [Caldisericia bacterium]
MTELNRLDPDVAKHLELELDRQRENIELIASENFVSKAVLEALGSIATNKYAEGYPGKRYYGGCEFLDVVEQLAIDRAKELFASDMANVQPHSGAQANLSAYFSILEPGDTIMGMNLSHGGHLTHGHPLSISGRYFKVVPYGVNESTETIDYDEMEKIASEAKPKVIVAGASAYPRFIDFERISRIAKSVGAYLMVDMAHIAGLVATNLHPSPVPHADIVTSTTHKTLRGPRGGLIVAKKELSKEINKAVFPGIQGGPLMHVIAAKAVCFKEAAQPEFKTYQEQVLKNAKTLARSLQGMGLRIVSGGTDNHLMLVDLRSKGLSGAEAESLMESIHITINKNSIPFDTAPPLKPSGIRLGTPAVTTRGMKEPEMEQIANIIGRVLTHKDDTKVIEQAKTEVSELTKRFPLYQGLSYL